MASFICHHMGQITRLTDELFRYCGHLNRVLIFGDLNSQTSDLSDFVEIDECLSELFGLEDIYNENAEILK